MRIAWFKSVAESGRSAFRELYQTEWTGEDLDTVRIAADNGGSPAFIDVLRKAASVRADDFGAPRRVPQPARWSLGMTMALTAILLASGGFWLWLRWRRGGSG